MFRKKTCCLEDFDCKKGFLSNPRCYPASKHVSTGTRSAPLLVTRVGHFEFAPRFSQTSEVLMNPVTVFVSTSTAPDPMLENAIRHRAYELYLQRGKAHGHDIDDWLQAEAELLHGHFTSDSNEP